LWERCLDDQADEALVAMLVSRIDAQAGAIVETVARAQREAATQGHHDPLSLSQLMLAHGEYTSHRLTDIAEPFETSLQWEDLILPTELMETLDEILAQATHREKVFEAWGFRRKMSYGRGLSCLFAGPPGTGKTMTAGLMAKRLQRPLFRVDLSRVTSKWVGETEKNLARVFDEAERGQVILLFDEADSLFGSRTEVKSSNDRYANLEVNYLLQRMEAYDGITILTTNFEKSIDEAFKRRLRFRVDFPFPDAEARERLWRAMLPPEAPIAPHLDFGALAHNYDMSGGNIKNAVLRAAFYAARQGHAIAFDHLERAAAAEAREIGLLIRTR
ncbi:MAG: ATP-binding protein, partial [Myxococcota bacterium]